MTAVAPLEAVASSAAAAAALVVPVAPVAPSSAISGPPVSTPATALGAVRTPLSASPVAGLPLRFRG